MTEDQQKSASSGRPAAELEKGNKDECRCEEVSKKSFLEMLKLMLNDLAFWKKKKNK